MPAITCRLPIEAERVVRARRLLIARNVPAPAAVSIDAIDDLLEHSSSLLKKGLDLR